MNRKNLIELVVAVTATGALSGLASAATRAATDEVVTARIRVAGARVLECQ